MTTICTKQLLSQASGHPDHMRGKLCARQNHTPEMHQLAPLSLHAATSNTFGWWRWWRT